MTTLGIHYLTGCAVAQIALCPTGPNFRRILAASLWP